VNTQLALIADSANVSVEGKLNILGEFDTIWAQSAPANHPSLWFVAKLITHESDIGKHRVLLRLVDEDGNTVLPPLTAALEIPAPAEGRAGDPRSVPVVLGLNNLPFASFGAYTFELRVDDRIVAQVPLYVRQLQQLGAEG